MRLIVLTSTLYASILTLFSCSNVNGGDAESAKDTLNYSYKTASFVQADSKITDSSLLFRSKIIYPEFDFKSNVALKDSVGHFISFSVFRGFASASEATKAFVDESIEQTKGMEGMSMMGWESNDSVSVVTNSSNLLCLKVSHYSFTGGAHGNPSETYANFSTNTGRRLVLEDIVEDGKISSLKDVNAAYLKKIRKVSTDSTLEESGLFVKGDDLPIPSSFALTQKGLLVSYNYYEIAPYVDGVIAYTIPFDLLKGILKADYILEK